MAIAVPAPLRPFPRVGAAVLSTRAEVLLIGGLVGCALAVRWPNLLLSPQFAAVGATVRLALDLADGRALPLSDQAPYLGPVFVYLLAAVYRLVGPSLVATMAVPWMLGGLTILPTYLLGREIGGRFAGAVAAALLATSGAHVVISSHVPLSHSLTPLVSTTTLWLLARAVTRREGRSLALAGLMAGLSVQTHPTVAPLLVAAAGGVVLQRPGWLRTRWAYLALALAVLGYGPLLAYHVQSRFEVVADIEGKQARYLDADPDPGEDAERGVYMRNLADLALSLARLSSGAIEEWDGPGDYLRDPRVLVYPAVALVGLALVARRQGFVLLGLAAGVLLPPLLSSKYKPILDGRYLMPLVPVLFVGIGAALAALASERDTPRLRLAAGAAATIIALALVLHPLAWLGEFYDNSLEDGASNSLYLRTLADLQAARVDGEPVLLDSRLNGVKALGGGNAGNSFNWLLAVSRMPAETWPGGEDAAPLAGRLAILTRDTAEWLTPRIVLSPLDGDQGTRRNRPSYRAYRVAAP